MKVAIYAIAKNEAKHVPAWAASTTDADYRIIADTGSTDDTAAVAGELGITVHHITINPWRFDDARNASLALIPNDVDYCIALDLDEQLQPGWRKELQKAHDAGWTRPRYRYTWSWTPDGQPGLVYGGDKIHARHGYRWLHPVHEVITPTGAETQGWIGLEIHHHPDSSKSRSQYLPLLEQAVREDPSGDRNAHYLAREYFFHGDMDRAAAMFRTHLALPSATWAPERAASMRYLAKCEPQHAETWLLRAAAEAPDRREAWVELALLHYHTQQWASCHAAALRALAISERPLEYLCEEFAWGALPHDLAAISAWQLGLDAEPFGAAAVAMNPADERLVGNLTYYRMRRRDAA